MDGLTPYQRATGGANVARWRALNGLPPQQATQQPVTREWDQALMDRVHKEHQAAPPNPNAPSEDELAARRVQHHADRHRILANRNAMVANHRQGKAVDSGIDHPEGTTIAEVWRGLPAPHAPMAAVAHPVMNAVAPVAPMLANALPGGGPLAAIIAAIHAAVPQARQALGGILGQ